MENGDRHVITVADAQPHQERYTLVNAMAHGEAQVNAAKEFQLDINPVLWTRVYSSGFHFAADAHCPERFQFVLNQLTCAPARNKVGYVPQVLEDRFHTVCGGGTCERGCRD